MARKKRKRKKKARKRQQFDKVAWLNTQRTNKIGQEVVAHCQVKLNEGGDLDYYQGLIARIRSLCK